jgi:hypothetical protein
VYTWREVSRINTDAMTKVFQELLDCNVKGKLSAGTRHQESIVNHSGRYEQSPSLAEFHHCLTLEMGMLRMRCESFDDWRWDVGCKVINDR